MNLSVDSDLYLFNGIKSSSPPIIFLNSKLYIEKMIKSII